MQLGQASVTSSDSTLFPVSLKTDLKVSSGRCAMSQPNSKRYPCLQAPVFGGRVCVSPNSNAPLDSPLLSILILHTFALLSILAVIT